MCNNRASWELTFCHFPQKPVLVASVSSLVKRGHNSVVRIKKGVLSGVSLTWISCLFLIGCSVISLVVPLDPLPIPQLPALVGSAFDFPLLTGEDQVQTLDRHSSPEVLNMWVVIPLGLHIRYLHYFS